MKEIISSLAYRIQLNNTPHFLLLAIWIGASLPLYSQGIKIEGEFTNCQEDTLSLFALDGTDLKPLIDIPLSSENGTHIFSLNFDTLPDGMYLLGKQTPKSPKAFLVDSSTQLKLTGNCESLMEAKIWLSPLNTNFGKAQRFGSTLQKKGNQLLGQLRKAYATGQDTTQLIQSLAELDKQKISYLDSTRKASPLIASILAPSTYLSYVNNGEGYVDEIEYFGKTYFQQAQLSDPVYNRLPVLRETFQNYAATLGSAGVPVDVLSSYLDEWLTQIPQPSPAHSSALIGAINGLSSRQPDGFVVYGRKYLDLYGNRNPNLSNQLKSAIASLQVQLIGSAAPEIALPTPEGDTLRLSDLKGKYVLVDFWASWCGPCRRENPNVVRVYNTYKDKGFEILGVSLDRSRAPWEKAIEKDGLNWLHVSALDYFNGPAATAYGVSAIPHTVLIDPEGKIAAKNLRGKSLANKLAQIFPETASSDESLNKE